MRTGTTRDSSRSRSLASIRRPPVASGGSTNCRGARDRCPAGAAGRRPVGAPARPEARSTEPETDPSSSAGHRRSRPSRGRFSTGDCSASQQCQRAPLECYRSDRSRLLPIGPVAQAHAPPFDPPAEASRACRVISGLSVGLAERPNYGAQLRSPPSSHRGVIIRVRRR